MKKLFTLSVITALTVCAVSQPPQLMSYQCVVRSTSGELISKQDIGVRTTILRGTTIQIIVYQETYSPNPSTNENGLLTLAIGSGNASIGDFSDINWSNGPYFLKTEMDPAGGISYTITGTSQLLSVPYSLYSKTAEDAETLKLPFSATIAHSDYAIKIANSASSAMNIASTATSGINFGINAETRSVENGTAAIRGSSATAGAAGTTYGVLGFSQSTSGRGVAGITNSLTGQTYGVYGNSYSSEGFGIYGYAGSETGNTTGVFGASNSPSGTAIYGICYPATGTGRGVSGHVNSPDGYSGYFTGGRFHVAGNAGIGTTNPSAKLEVAGQVKITGGTPAAGQVLTSDASGLATWEPVTAPSVNQIYFEVKRDASYNWPVNATNQKVDFSSNSTLWENQGNAFNLTSSIFTAPEDGIYSFRGAIMFRNLDTGSLTYAFLTAGNKNYYSNYRYSSGASEMVDVSITLFLAKNQTAYLGGYVNDLTPTTEVYGNTTTDYSFTFFSGAKVR